MDDTSAIKEKTRKTVIDIFSAWHDAITAPGLMASEFVDDGDEENEVKEDEENEAENLLGPGELTINGSVIPVHDWLGEEMTQTIVSIMNPMSCSLRDELS